MKLAHALVVGLACTLSLAASAQWQWIDGAGKKVFSDQPPPMDVPEKNILNKPRNAPTPRANPVIAPDATPGGPATPPAAAGPKPVVVDKELEEKTRKAEDAEKAKKAAEAEKQAKAKADNCAQARQSKATYDSGARVARINAQGEREFLDDDQRAAETQRAQSVIDKDCR
jgi:hypothetical protein